MDYILVVSLLLIASLFLEYFFRERLFHSLKERVLWASAALIIGIPWDWYAIPRQHWTFSGKGILGIYFGPLPIEELLWFLVVPYFWLTVYEAIHTRNDLRGKKKWKK